ncbi:MAG: hypothetical protein BWX64_01561 [Acidobacteria bacterium ADurb.Bin051]|nr:MAG: hypothetical protein BWX64_01561 [Acidobacteria bacterium ADurb.Bin051]
MRSRFIVGSILIAALLLLTPGVRAQDLDALDFRGPVTPAAALAPEAASAYTFSQASGTYAAITGGTVHGTGTGVDDNSYNGVNIGFTFNFDGVDYTQLGINANGFVRMGGTAFSGSCGYAPISSTDNTNCANVVSALGMDLQGNAGAELRSELTGTAPNRIFTVQWTDFRNYNQTVDSYTFQIRLHETSNQIEIVYGAFTKNATNRTPQVGIRGATNADFNNRTTTTDWTASTAGAANSATMALRTTVLPPSGLTFGWAPPNFPPAISYAPLGNTASTADRAFSGVAITDADGVNTTPGTRPRVYYKRATDGNVWNDNTSGTDGWKYAEANGTTSPFDFTIDYALLNGGTGVSAGDAVQYFVVAQDLAATPAVGINSGTFAAAPASVALTAAAFPIGGTINSYRIASLMSGTYSVPGDYPSLTNPGGIFEALNNNIVTADVVIEITGDLTAETGTVALNQLAEEPAGSDFTVRISPSGAARTISGTSAASTGLINLNGADRVTIDGSLSGGTDQSLTITNLATGGVVIWIHSTAGGNGATHNTIENCILNGSGSTGTVAGVLAGASAFGSPAEAPNSDNTIRNNVVTRVQNAAFLYGAATGLDQNWLITGNTFGSTVAADKLGFRGLFIGNVGNLTVSQNTIQGVVSSPTSGSTMSGIQVGATIAGGLIERNRISDIKHTSTTGWGSNGLFLNATSTASNLTVANNFISDVASHGYNSGTSQSDNGYGIMVNGGGGYNLYFNSVLMATNQTNGGIPAAINIASGVAAGSLDLRDNIFANAQTAGTRYVIYSAAPATVFSAIDYNDYFADTGVTLGYLGSARATLGDWQTATGQDANSLAADPLFVSTTDLHLSGAASPAVGAGTPIAGITVDIDGDARSATMPNLGADEINWTVTASVGTPSGTIAPPSQTVAGGDTATFTLTPDTGYEIDSVTGTCPAGSFAGNVYTTGAITGDCEVIAHFRVITLTVTPSVGTPAGTITPDTPQLVDYGDTATFTLTPDSGYEIDGVTGTCGGTLTGNSYETAAVVADCTVVAHFRLSLPNIDVSPLAMSSSQAAGTVTNQTLNVGNTGVADLTWTIDEEPAPRPGLANWSDDFDSYATGSQLHGQGGWKGWGNDPAFGALVSAAQSRSTPNSVAVVGTTDLLHEYGETSGQWVFTAWQYVPTTFDGESYFIMLNTYDDAGANNNWSVQVRFDGAANQVVNDGGSSGGTLPLVRGRWVEIRVEIDLDTDTGAFYYDNQQLYSGTWSGQVSGGGAQAIAAVDLFADDSSVVYYDDMSLVDANQPPVCSNPADVPWLSVSPTSGTTAPGVTTPVTVTFDSTGLAAGTYNANLCVTSDDPDPGPGNGTDLVVVPVSLTVTAPVMHTVTSSVGTPSGTIAPPSQSVAHGATATFTLTPDPGYAIDTVGGTCPAGTLAGNLYTTGAITADCQVIAHFRQLTHTVTSSVGTPSGTIVPPSQTVAHGATTTFTLTPDAGFEIDGVGGTCPAGTLAGNVYTTGAITADCEVVANFRPESGPGPSVLEIPTLGPAGGALLGLLLAGLGLGTLRRRRA